MKLCANLTEPNPTLEFLLGTALGCGKEGLTAMTWLDKGHTTNLGKPEPTEVPRTPVEGKAILVSGHDLMVLQRLLEQSKGKNVNIYTHSEMLPAFGYPAFKKYPHLVANFGTAWYD